MSTPEPDKGPTLEPEDGAGKRRNPWIWVSAVLGVAAVGLLVWALSIQSDLDGSQKEAQELQAQLDESKETGGAVLANVKAVYEDLTAELGATSEDLTSAEQDLDAAEQDAAKAEQDAATAEQNAGEAENQTDKAKAEADEAKAQAQAAESKAAIAAECAKAYTSALGALFEGESVRAQAEMVRQELESISTSCKTALAGA